MPRICCFTTADGQTEDRVIDHGKDAPRWVFVDGKVATRDMPAEMSGSGIETEWSQPILSMGVGCHKKQAAAMRAAAAKHNVPLELVEHHGVMKAKFTSRAQRRDVLRWAGIHDNDGGYGDG